MRRLRITKDEIGIYLGGEEPTLVHFPLEMCRELCTQSSTTGNAESDALTHDVDPGTCPLHDKKP
jgi:hypothetical protein